MVNRVVTGAHYGLRDWLAQRVSAAVMAVYALFMAAWVLFRAPVGYEAWTGLFASNAVRAFTLLAMLAMFYHAWVGVRDIVMDYIGSAGLRLAIHAVVILALMLYAIWSVQILWAF
jgi:succinate dehydrogenase membrane anchor subunit